MTAEERQAIIVSAKAVLNDPTSTPDQKVAALIDVLRGQMII